MLNDPADVTQEQNDYWEQKCHEMETIKKVARESYLELLEIKCAVAVTKTIIFEDGLYTLRLMKHG